MVVPGESCSLSGSPTGAEVEVEGTWRVVSVAVAAGDDVPPRAGSAVSLSGASWFVDGPSCAGTAVTATGLRLSLADRVTVTATVGSQPAIVVGCDGALGTLSVSAAGSFTGYG